MENRLILCAGIVRRAGWLTLDIKGGDFTATIPPLPSEVKAVLWDEIEWVHGVGSFLPWVAESILKEIREVLGTGGKLVLEQPNFDIAKNRVEWVFGDPSHKDSLIMNRWAYTPGTLGDLLEKVGYHSIRLLPAQYHVPDRDFRMEAYK